jgi:hypothetical protein
MGTTQNSKDHDLVALPFYKLISVFCNPYPAPSGIFGTRYETHTALRKIYLRG